MGPKSVQPEKFGVVIMKKVTLILDDYLYEFYKKIGENAGQHSPEKVMEDVLFRLAGELSVDAVENTKNTE